MLVYAIIKCNFCNFQCSHTNAFFSVRLTLPELIFGYFIDVRYIYNLLLKIMLPKLNQNFSRTHKV